MKKLLAVLLTVMMALTFVGCNKVDPNKKSEGTMTYAEYVAAPVDSKVVIEGYVVASQSYWGGATLYVADGDGAYFVYQDSKLSPNISEEDWGKLGITAGEPYNGFAKEGVKVHVEGYKSEWSGEVEITDCKVTVLENEAKWLPTATEIKAADAENWLKDHANQLVTIKDATVKEAALYKWDGSGNAGENCDLYITFTIGSADYSFVVESYLMYEGTDVYNTALSLKAGDKVTLTGFLYAYNGPQMHITGIVK